MKLFLSLLLLGTVGAAPRGEEGYYEDEAAGEEGCEGCETRGEEYYYGEDAGGEEYYYGEDTGGEEGDYDYEKEARYGGRIDSDTAGEDEYYYGEEYGEDTGGEEGYYDYEKEARYGGRNYSDYYTGRPYSPEGPPNLGRMLGIRDPLEFVEEAGEGYRWGEDIRDFFESHLIPELCYLKPSNYSIYNSFFLDRNCLSALEEDATCSGFKCAAVRHVLEEGAEAWVRVLTAEDILEGVRYLEEYLINQFMADVGFCSCGRRFLKTFASKCLPRYNSANWINSLDLEEETYRALLLLQNNLDIKTISRLVDELVGGVCEETEAGICLNNIVNLGRTTWDIVQQTIEGYEAWDEGTQRDRKKLEGKCDNGFSAVRAWVKTETSFDDDNDLDTIESWEGLLEKSAEAASKFYCNKKCKKNRAEMYPCCVRSLLHNDKIWDSVVTLLEQVMQLYPALADEVYYELSGLEYRWGGYEEDEEDYLARYRDWSLPEGVRDLAMRTLHAARYCEDVTVKCGK